MGLRLMSILLVLGNGLVTSLLEIVQVNVHQKKIRGPSQRCPCLTFPTLVCPLLSERNHLCIFPGPTGVPQSPFAWKYYRKSFRLRISTPRLGTPKRDQRARWRAQEETQQRGNLPGRLAPKNVGTNNQIWKKKSQSLVFWHFRNRKNDVNILIFKTVKGRKQDI